jgi:hypothetical protein
VLRHGRTTDRQALGKLIDRLRRAPQFLQQEPPASSSPASDDG